MEAVGKSVCLVQGAWRWSAAVVLLVVVAVGAVVRGWLFRQPGECLVLDGKRFEKGEEVGRGVAKRVFKAYADGGVCAWIETRRELPVEYVRWVKRGYDILYELEEHKNIQRPDYVWQAAKNNQVIRIVALEFLHETTLREIALPVDRITGAVREIAEGVAFLHKHYIMHRDLKPTNILVHCKEGKYLLRITDFDYAQRLGKASARVKEVSGSPAFYAPEIFFGRGVGLKGDVWALALVVYQMLRRSLKDPGAVDRFPPFVEIAYEPVDWDRWVDEGKGPTAEVSKQIGEGLCGEIKLDLPEHSLVPVIKLGLAVEEKRCTALEFLQKLPVTL